MRFLLCLIAVALFSAPALAACYTTSEAEAEQAIRIHSELMIIGLNCQHKTAAGQANLYGQYKQFTAKNGSLFAGYEKVLISYFRRAGGNEEKCLNDLRTRFANKISLDAARMRPDMFCQYYAPRIKKASAMTGAQLRQWAATFFPSHPPSQPVCAAATIRRCQNILTSCG